MNSRTQRRAFTLVETIVTSLIVAIVFLSIASGILYVLKSQRIARERAFAQREAAAILETARCTTLRSLETWTGRPVVIDDNRTPDDDSDDLSGTAAMRLFAPDGTPVAEAERLDLVVVQAEVRWFSQNDAHEVILVSHLAP